MAALFHHSPQAEEQQQDEHSAATAQPCSPALPAQPSALQCRAWQDFSFGVQLRRKHGCGVPLSRPPELIRTTFFLKELDLQRIPDVFLSCVLLCLSVLCS